MAGLGVGTLALLAAIGVIGGVGISAVGPGGVLPTIGLFVLTPLAPATVAGTAIATNIATGIAGTAAYTASGQLRDRATRRTALILAGTAVLGTPPGVAVNGQVSSRLFGVLLAGFCVAVAALVWLRGRREGAGGAGPGTEPGTEPGGEPGTGPGTEPGAGPGGELGGEPGDSRPGWVVVAGLGLLVGLVSGMLGLGGPLLTVPLLIALGLAALPALGAAQAQSVVIASVGTLAYAVSGSVDWALVLLIGLPELAGVLIGWRIARALPTRTLRAVLVAALLALAPYLALRG